MPMNTTVIANSVRAEVKSKLLLAFPLPDPMPVLPSGQKSVDEIYDELAGAIAAGVKVALDRIISDASVTVPAVAITDVVRTGTYSPEAGVSVSAAPITDVPRAGTIS